MPEERSIPVSALRAWIKGMKFGDATLVTIVDLEKSIDELDALCNNPPYAKLNPLQQALRGNP